MGHKSIDAPSRVSTALNGESGSELSSGGKRRGATVGWVLVFGGVPSERAAITS